MRVKMIDPPEGDEYGFPKAFDAPEGTSINEWLLANGYPKNEIDAFPDGVPCRIYFVEHRDP